MDVRRGLACVGGMERRQRPLVRKVVTGVQADSSESANCFSLAIADPLAYDVSTWNCSAVNQGRFSVPRLSCIIPVVGHAHGLETTLVSVLEHFPDDCEIIVVHSAKYDDPYDLKSELRFIEAPARTGFVGCANLGIQASHAPIVHLLSAGLEATGGWAEAALSRFADPKVAAVAPVVRNQFDSDEILAAGISYHAGGRAEVRTLLPAGVSSTDIANSIECRARPSRFRLPERRFIAGRR